MTIQMIYFIILLWRKCVKGQPINSLADRISTVFLDFNAGYKLKKVKTRLKSKSDIILIDQEADIPIFDKLQAPRQRKYILKKIRIIPAGSIRF